MCCGLIEYGQTECFSATPMAQYYDCGINVPIIIHNVALIKFVDPSYRVAAVGGHTVYKIEDTMIYPINATGSRPTHPDESK